jgi:hypothetical protein
VEILGALTGFTLALSLLALGLIGFLFMSNRKLRKDLEALDAVLDEHLSVDPMYSEPDQVLSLPKVPGTVTRADTLEALN